LSLSALRESGRSVVVLDGELDLASVPDLRSAALAALDEPECSVLVLDLERLTFLDSTGIGCWIELRNHAEQLGKTVEFRSIPSAARRTVTIAGLAGLFGIDAS
jgi:anti-sigma B factor antagonist